jgi:hypothetical protein
MLAHRRSDVRELNEAARHLLLEAGRLGDHALIAGEREFRIGDRVLCRRNNSRLNVRNGMRGTIVRLDPSTQTLMLEIDAGPERLLPAAYAAEHLDYGYALTGHAAQGATFEHTFVLLRDEGALQEWGYVACTRARSETRLFLVGDGPEREAHGRHLEPRDASDRLADALTTSAADRLALEHASPTVDMRDRLLQQHCRQVDEARAKAKQRLAQAEAKLDTLGWRGRRKHGPELQSEIALEQAMLRLAEKKLAELDTLPPTTAPARPRAPALAPSRSRDRGLSCAVDREPPGTGLEL